MYTLPNFFRLRKLI